MSNAPIGVFDSGVGGLTVARAIIDQLPNEEIHYLGDTANSPYGPKPLADVRKYALEAIDHLIDSGVKMVVIACNTASSAMLRDARERYSVPIVEVIQPAVRSAIKITSNNKVGVIGTRATVASRAYEDAFAAAPHLELHTKACPRFVEFVENGITTGDEILQVAHEYLEPLKESGIDTLVLGCTHYPYLKGAISYVMGDGVTLVSSDTETANDVYRELVRLGIERTETTPPEHRFEVTGKETKGFSELAGRLIGPSLGKIEVLKN
ncbi:MAG: glutamate racemase [Microbacteriaceae bacterium]|nr:glutamate racemase [Microbacteriaceae bacterium]